MQTGWLHRRGCLVLSEQEWSDVDRLAGCWIISWYYFDGDGAMQSGCGSVWRDPGIIFVEIIERGDENRMQDSQRGKKLLSDPGSVVWKDIRLAVIGNSEAGAITTAAKFVEMGADATVVSPEHLRSPGMTPIARSRWRSIWIRRDYGQTNTASGNIDNILDERQIDAVKQCVAAGKPIFGICKGVQLINVVFGGTLNQSVSQVIWEYGTR